MCIFSLNHGPRYLESLSVFLICGSDIQNLQKIVPHEIWNDFTAWYAIYQHDWWRSSEGQGHLKVKVKAVFVCCCHSYILCVNMSKISLWIKNKVPINKVCGTSQGMTLHSWSGSCYDNANNIMSISTKTDLRRKIFTFLLWQFHGNSLATCTIGVAITQPS